MSLICVLSFVFLTLQFAAPVWVGENSFQSEIALAQSNYPEIEGIHTNIASFTYAVGEFICHQRPDRSLKVSGNYLPLCVRCLGILVGMTMTFGYSLFVINPTGKFFEALNQFLPPRLREIQPSWLPVVLIGAMLMTPMTLDGLAQLITGYESTNVKRIITGFLFGIGEGGLIVGIVSHLCYYIQDHD